MTSTRGAGSLRSFLAKGRRSTWPVAFAIAALVAGPVFLSVLPFAAMPAHAGTTSFYLHHSDEPAVNDGFAMDSNVPATAETVTLTPGSTTRWYSPILSGTFDAGNYVLSFQCTAGAGTSVTYTVGDTAPDGSDSQPIGSTTQTLVVCTSTQTVTVAANAPAVALNGRRLVLTLAIAQALQVLVMQTGANTALAAPGFTAATATPTPTSTLTPTVTPTATSTPTVTPTPGNASTATAQAANATATAQAATATALAGSATAQAATATALARTPTATPTVTPTPGNAATATAQAANATATAQAATATALAQTPTATPFGTPGNAGSGRVFLPTVPMS